jgi:hypothetical protein
MQKVQQACKDASVWVAAPAETNSPG